MLTHDRATIRRDRRRNQRGQPGFLHPSGRCTYGPRPVLRSGAPRTPTSGCHRRRSRTGAALTTTLIGLMVLEILGAAILSLASTGLNLAERSRRATLAFNLAESGTERAARWLKDQPSPPSGTTAMDPFGGVQTLGDGTYTVSVLPDPGNPGADLKRYTVTATASVQGRTQQVQLVLRQSSFGKYAYFTDKEVSSIGGGTIWFFSGDRIRGPAHSNNSDGGTFHVNWTGSTAPIFEDMLTSAASSITYAPSNPASESDYLKIFKTGSRGYQLGVDGIPLPSSTSVQQAVAWGAASGFPASPGVYVPNGAGATTGGIYINGDASVQMQVDGSGNQQFLITQGATTTTITVDLASNQTRVQVGSGAVQTYSGTGSGVLYSTGNITSLSGTVADNRLSVGSPPAVVKRSAYTIATDVNNGKNITLTGPVKYKSAPDPTLPTNDPVNLQPGTLGLLGRNVIVASGAPTGMEIDAVMLAGSSSTTDGSFYVANWNSKSPTGTLKVVGGIIQKARGPVGTFSGGSISTGYAKNYYYDPRLADNPPPYFPTTGNYDRISWRKLPG